MSQSLFDMSSWRHKHVLDVNNFSASEIELVMSVATKMKGVLVDKKEKLASLQNKTVVTLFFEASTRTRGSFEMAAKRLGADTLSFSAQSSSVSKGESLINTLKTLESIGADMIVMRHPMSGAHYHAAPYLESNLINAGDGWHAHPTQALLDLFTMQSHFKDMNNRKVVIIGDVKHSRVAHSNIWCLSKMGVNITLCSPPPLLPAGLDKPNRFFPNVTLERRIEKAMADADVIMLLRLQKERMSQGFLTGTQEYIDEYQLNSKRLSLAKPNAIVMHPGPVNVGIEMTSDVLECQQSVVEQQVTNGVAIRMAILQILNESSRE